MIFLQALYAVLLQEKLNFAATRTVSPLMAQILSVERRHHSLRSYV